MARHPHPNGPLWRSKSTTAPVLRHWTAHPSNCFFSPGRHLRTPISPRYRKSYRWKAGKISLHGVLCAPNNGISIRATLYCGYDQLAKCQRFWALLDPLGSVWFSQNAFEIIIHPFPLFFWSTGVTCLESVSRKDDFSFFFEVTSQNSVVGSIFNYVIERSYISFQTCVSIKERSNG